MILAASATHAGPGRHAAVVHEACDTGIFAGRAPDRAVLSLRGNDIFARIVRANLITYGDRPRWSGNVAGAAPGPAGRRRAGRPRKRHNPTLADRRPGSYEGPSR